MTDREKERHPDTGIVFGGYAIPYFNEAVGLALYAHRCFKYLFSAGWDVAITPRGPTILEGNARFGIHGLQQPDRGLRKVFLENMKPAVIVMAQKYNFVYNLLRMRRTRAC